MLYILNNPGTSRQLMVIIGIAFIAFPGNLECGVLYTN